MCSSYLRLFFCLLFLNLFKLDALETFTIGTTSAYAPYVSLNDQGEYVGFDIDFANALATKLNRQLVIKDLGSMPSLFLALKQNKVDALIWAISITPDRQKQMEMIYYQGEKVNELPLLFWSKIPENVQTISDLANKSQFQIAVESGSFQDSFLSTIPGLSLKHVDKIMDAILEIKYGKSTATMVDPSLLSKIISQFPLIKVLNVPLSESQQSLGNGICINKTNAKLIVEVNQYVKELIDEGLVGELEKKWKLSPLTQEEDVK